MSSPPKGLRFSERKLWEQRPDDEPVRKVLARLVRTRDNERSLEDQLATLRTLITDRFHEAKEYKREPEAAFLAYLLDALREDAGRLGKLGGQK